MSWADAADRTIKEALAGVPADATPAEIEKAIRAAYPFGERKYTPYKVWLARVKSWMLAIAEAERNGMPRPRYLNRPYQHRPPKRDRETLKLL